MRRLVLLFAFLLTIGLSYGQTNYSMVCTGTNFATVATSTTDNNFVTGTIELWAKPGVSSSGNCLFSMRNATSTRVGFHLINCTTLDIWNGTSGGQITYPFVIGTWYHIAFVIKTSTTDVYINGNLAGTYNVAINTSGTNTGIGIGAIVGGTEIFTGELDDVRLWSTQRTAEQIKANMKTTLSMPQDGLLANWTFDDLTTSGVYSSADKTGNGKTAVFTGITAGAKLLSTTIANVTGFNYVAAGSTNVSVAVNGQNPCGEVAKVELYAGTTKIGESTTVPYTFNIPTVSATVYSSKAIDAVGNFSTSTLNVEGVQTGGILNFTTQSPVVVPANPAFQLGANGTISLWVCPTFSALSANPGLVGCQSGSSRYYDFEMLGDRTGLGFYNGAWKTITYTPTFLVGKWYNITYVLKSGDVDVYVNGVLVGSFGQGVGTGTGQAFNIGCQYAGTGNFVGGIDEVKVWSVQKTSTEILEMYTTQKTDYMNLEGYWKFDDLAPVATDYSGNGRNGAFVQKILGKLPTIDITKPVASTFTAGTNITLEASVTGTTAGTVYYYNNGTLIGSSSTSPYNVTLNTATLTNTNIDLTAVLVYNAATGARVGDRLFLKNTAAPSIAITNLEANKIYNNAIPILVNASDDVSVTKVDFYVSTTSSYPSIIATSTEAPYSFNFTNVNPGTSYFIKAVATDNVGNTTSTDGIVVRANAKPTISAITAASVQASPVSLTLTATDADGTISKVEIFSGRDLIATLTSSPYKLNYTAALGVYTFSAVAYDNLGATASTASKIVTVKLAPTVAISTPANNDSYSNPTNIILGATASSNTNTTVSVMYYSDGAAISGAIASPYTFNWVSGLTVGTHTLKAVATDSEGLVSTSNSINVTINTAAPSIVINSVAQTSPFKYPVAKATITATATDTDGSIAKVLFFDGATYLGLGQAVSTTGVYSFQTTNLAAGDHTFSVVAVDNFSSTTTVSATAVTVASNTLPTISLSTPKTLYRATESVVLSSLFADTDDGIASVVFSGATVPSTTTSPYSFNLGTLALGTYTIKATATDILGAVSTATTTFVVANNVAPVLTSLTTPLGTVFTSRATFTVAVAATDADGSISRIELYNGDDLVETTTNSLYTFTLSTMPMGTYYLTIAAYDNEDAFVTSSKITIVVKKNTSVETTLADLAVKAYPNPFQANLNVVLKGIFEYTIYDLTGSVVEKGFATDKATVGAKLQTGLYLLNVKQNGSTKTIKVEKQ